LATSGFVYGCSNDVEDWLLLRHSWGRVVRTPVAPQTIGDHIRKRRVGLKLLQKDVADQLGVCEPSVYNWEANTSTPEIRYMPAIIRFLGYNPLPLADTLAGQLVRQRTSLGLSQKESAKGLSVDPATLARWERGEREPAGMFLDRVERFLNQNVDGHSSDARRAG
jgi:transcriptional regulator with XRE-family HTH domain